MSPRTILTLANGRGVDLVEPMFYPADFDALAEQLAKEKRYNGATPGVEMSVAEHCCIGCDAILAWNETAICSSDIADEDDFMRVLAAYFLMHDLHEAVWKDDTTPKKRALAEMAEQNFGILADHVVQAFDLAVYRLDEALHSAAGLQWPPRGDYQHFIKKFDKIMFVTEWRDLMGNRDHPDWSPYVDIEPLPEVIGTPWTWRVAKQAWLRRAEGLLPALRNQTAKAAS